MRLYALCGSLRAASHNRVALEALQLLGPDMIAIDEHLPHLPLFNPDAEKTALPQAVVAMRRLAAEADGLIIASPEYARGVAAPLKNALEWLVGCAHLVPKKAMIVNTSPRASDAQAQLRLVLSTMGLEVVEEASLTLPLLSGPHRTGGMVLADPPLRSLCTEALHLFVERCKPSVSAV